MLKELKIKNLAIIEDLTVNFGPGLNVLTGETGAGKSIIVDALGLALGDRAQPDFIKSGEKEATVQALFELNDPAALPDIGIDMSEGVVLRRLIAAVGRSRAYINDTIVTLQTMSEIGKALVDIHSQHEHQSLLSPDKQKSLLDAYGKLHTARATVASLFSDVQGIQEKCRMLRERQAERAQRIDLIRFQIDEIDKAGLQAGEKEALERDRMRLVNIQKLQTLTDRAYALLYGADGSCSEQLSATAALLAEMSAIDPGVEPILAMLQSALPLVEDASFALRSYKDRGDEDPAALETIEDRLDLIRRLEGKYGRGVEAIVKYRDNAEEELKELERTDEALGAAEHDLVAREDELLRAATALSEKRREKAALLERLISESLRELAFSKAELKIVVTSESSEDGTYRIGPTGMDRVEFLFTANPGEHVKPLSKIISGGELSRVMLALKSVLAEADGIPVLIFDEVDAGIGGKTAETVGRKLDGIAERHQLLCITHLPQIASYGDIHLRIEKRERGGRVSVQVKGLSGQERRDEIARMLSGSITEISRRHAGELLERTR